MSKEPEQQPRTITMTMSEETFLKWQQSQPPASQISTWLRVFLTALAPLVAHPLAAAIWPFFHHV